MPLVDLHDLNAALARRAVRSAGEEAGDLACGAVCFVTGRGRHNLSRKAVLRQVAGEVLADLRARNGWDWHPAGPGRLVLVADPRRAPAWTTSRPGWGCWLLAAAFAAAAVFAFPPAAVLLPVALGVGWYLSRERSRGARGD